MSVRINLASNYGSMDCQNFGNISADRIGVFLAHRGQIKDCGGYVRIDSAVTSDDQPLPGYRHVSVYGWRDNVPETTRQAIINGLGWNKPMSSENPDGGAFRKQVLWESLSFI